jgi:hypothetical protein
LGFLGLPSLHDIVEAIAGNFFTALADALVPGFLRRATVATVQQLVALPDPAAWEHVGRLQDEMVFLGAMLLPVTLAAGTLRYWLVGLTGRAHPTVAVARCAWVSGLLVAYRWIVEQTVAATNTLTHAILALPQVSAGVARLVGVLFGGALLTGTGGVFGAFLVIVGVVFAAGLFAAQVLVTVALAVLVVTGPPLLALAVVPELAHLAGMWARALLGLTLVPLGWTVLFATAGALTLDATSFTGGGNGLPGEVAAAFAALITFVLAVRLPWTVLASLRRTLAPAGGGVSSAGATRAIGGMERVAHAHARLRSAGVAGALSLGGSAGFAAGALGAPAGGLAGVARRRVTRARSRTGNGSGRAPQDGASPATRARSASLRERIVAGGLILRDAPRRARRAAAAAGGTTANRRPDSGRRGGGDGARPGGSGAAQRAQRDAREPTGGPAGRGGPPSSPGDPDRGSRTAGGAAAATRDFAGGRRPAKPAAAAAPRGAPRPPRKDGAPGKPAAKPPARTETAPRGRPHGPPPPPPPPPTRPDPVRPARPRKPDRRPRKRRDR